MSKTAASFGAVLLSNWHRVSDTLCQDPLCQNARNDNLGLTEIVIGKTCNRRSDLPLYNFWDILQYVSDFERVGSNAASAAISRCGVTARRRSDLLCHCVANFLLEDLGLYDSAKRIKGDAFFL